jgi:beta-lactamase regulating signal transducer with metallopeptidase domain
MDLVIRASLLVAAGVAVALLLHRQAASLRHLVWSASLGGSIALAVMVPWAPRLDFPVPGRLVVDGTVSTSGVVVNPDAVRATDPAPPMNPATVRDRIVAVAPAVLTTTAAGGAPMWVGVWLAGLLLVAGWGLLGRLGLTHLVRRATPILDGSWRSIVDEAARSMNVHRPIRIFSSETVGAPVTWGTRRPVLVIPASAVSWSYEVRRSVAAHEVAHIARRDYRHQLIALGACAIYWFHPLVWAAARRMRQTAERACDDLVLASGTSGEDYAGHLIRVARGSRALRLAGAVAIGMARPTTLEGRIVAVLDEKCRRGAASRRSRLTIGVAAAAALVVFGALRPVSASARGTTPAEGAVALNEVAMPEAVRPEPRAERPSLAPPVASTPASQDGRGRRQDLEHEVRATPGERLELDLPAGGAVTIRGWDENRVVVRTHLGGEDWQDIAVDVDRQASGVQVRARYVRRMNVQSSTNRFDIRVPRQYDVRISSAGGTLTVIGVEGRFNGHTGGGGFVLEGLTGSATLSTGGGAVHVTDSHLSGRVQTGGGTVMLSRVSGGLRGSSGSGPVIYGETVSGSGRSTTDLSSVEVDGPRISIGRNTTYAAGTLVIDKAGGAVELDAAPNGARIHTGGGHVRVGPSSGFVSASTGGGDMRIGPVSGSVLAGTGAGDVHIIIDRMTSEEQVIDASSGKGRVTIELPRDFTGRLDLETAHTESHERTARIDSDWELEREPLTGWDDRQGTPRRYLRATARIGRGNARVVVRTVNGEIEIRRR